MMNGMTLLVSGNVLLGVLVIVLLLWDAFGDQEEEAERPTALAPGRDCGSLRALRGASIKKSRCG